MSSQGVIELGFHGRFLFMMVGSILSFRKCTMSKFQSLMFIVSVECENWVWKLPDWCSLS